MKGTPWGSKNQRNNGIHRTFLVNQTLVFLHKGGGKKNTLTHKTCGNKLMTTSTKWEHELHGMWIKEKASAKHVRKIVNIILAIMIIVLYTLLHLITILCSFHAMEMD